MPGKKKIDFDSLLKEHSCPVCKRSTGIFDKICDSCKEKEQRQAALDAYKAKFLASGDPLKILELIVEEMYHIKNRKPEYAPPPVFR